MATETLSGDVSSAILLGFVIVFLIFYMWTRRPPGIPPFPATPLPVIGNALSLEKDTSQLFGKWRQAFGDIFSLYLGSQLVIVLNGFECMKEAIQKNADMFSDRPNVLMFQTIFRGRGIGSTSGPLWKSQRKFALKALRDFGFGRNSMEGKVLEEVDQTLKYFASKQGKKEHFDQIYNISTSNILCSVVFGRRFEYDDPMFLESCKSLDTFMNGIANTGLANTLPFLQYLPGDLAGIKTIMKSIEFVEEKLIKPEIERHVREYDGTAKDFISAYIKEIKDKENAGQDVTELRDNFTQTICDLFIGGTETTATTLKWLILFLIRYPEIQEKCFQEIKDNIGLSRLPELKDKSLLPYVEATLAETQRRANIVPLGVLHGVAENTKFRGFNFPKGTAVMLNMDSVLMDSKVWSNPDDFRPERFLNEDGRFFKPEAFIPFSLGRRVCLGEALAKMELSLLGTALMQRFQFKNPEDEPKPTLKAVIGASVKPVPYKVKAIPRM